MDRANNFDQGGGIDPMQWHIAYWTAFMTVQGGRSQNRGQGSRIINPKAHNFPACADEQGIWSRYPQL
jgi:hypothetical protein